MRRSLLVLLCLLTLAGAFTGCNLFTKDVMSAIVYVQHYYTGRRAPDWDVITVPSIWLSGQVSGSKMPAFDYLQVNDKQISGRDIYFFEQGYVRFDSYHRVWQDSIAAPGFYPMTVTLATDIGELVGSVEIPDTLSTLTVSVSDTVPLGTPVTVSWTGGNADYYYVWYYHLWEEAEWYWLGYSRDTVVAGNSVTFDSTYFTKNAELGDFEVYPVNGPMPAAGAIPNMSGDGSGFLYCDNKEISSDVLIVFGEGINIPDFGKRPAHLTPVRSTPESRKKAIAKRLGM